MKFESLGPSVEQMQHDRVVYESALVRIKCDVQRESLPSTY